MTCRQKKIAGINLLFSFTVRVPGLEPGTSPLSVECSNHLSYTRMFAVCVSAIVPEKKVTLNLFSQVEGFA